MRPNPTVVSPDVTMDVVVYDWFLRHGVRALPVVHDGRVIGIVTLSDVKSLPRERWATTTVRELMTPSPLVGVGPEEPLSKVLRLLSEHDIHQVLVTQDGKLVGVLSRADLIRYMQLVGELGLTSALRPGTPGKSSRPSVPEESV